MKNRWFGMQPHVSSVEFARTCAPTMPLKLKEKGKILVASKTLTPL